MVANCCPEGYKLENKVTFTNRRRKMTAGNIASPKMALLAFDSKSSQVSPFSPFSFSLPDMLLFVFP